MSTIIARLACVVREMSLNALIGRAIWYGYNTPSANPCRMGTITPSADVGWPVWIGSLSSRVARVVREVPLKGLHLDHMTWVPCGMGRICHQMSYFENIDHVSCTVFRGPVPLFHMLQGQSVRNGM